jgi:hypothetical protein
VTTGSLGFEGDVPHTVSTWINASNLEANATTQQIFSIGSGYDKAFLKVDDTQIAANTWHNVTYAYQGEGGSKVTYVDGRKVEEAQVEDTFGQYPPFAMTDYKTGGYCVTASNEDYVDGYFPWRVFDYGTVAVGESVGWFSDQLGNYNGANGTVTSTSTVRLAPETEKGDWLQLEFPYLFKMDYFTIFSQSYSQTTHTVDNLILYAKKELSDTWTSLGTFTGIAARQSASGVTEVVNTTEMYKYFAIVGTKRHAQHSTDGLTIRELKYYGHKEGDLTRFPEPTRVLKYPHVTMTGPGQRGYVASANEEQANFEAYKAFNNLVSSSAANLHHWTSPNLNYDNNGDFTPTAAAIHTTNVGGTSKYGNWCQIELPHKLKYSYSRIRAPYHHIGRQPREGYIVGSNDLSGQWTILHNFSGVTRSAATDYSTYTPSSAPTQYFKYIRIVIEKLGSGAGSQAYAGIDEWELYGVQENTGTPAIVGGPFAGKVANFRVYDQYLGDERIQEIYDAQKDEFGHKKSSMTFYKGRIGVGTTEPEGALTVIDEPHALEKFPKHGIVGETAHVEGQGLFRLTTADIGWLQVQRDLRSPFRALDGNSTTSWDSTPARNTRLSEETEFGSWFKIESPEKFSLKKAEFRSNPHWQLVGRKIGGSNSGEQSGRGVALNHDGTRLAVGSMNYDLPTTNDGLVRVYDWDGKLWNQIGENIEGTSGNQGYFGRQLCLSGDGSILAAAEALEHSGTFADNGRVRVYKFSGSTWTILPDSGLLTNNGIFEGANTLAYLGNHGVRLSYDGKIIAISEHGFTYGSSANTGRVRVFEYSNGAWNLRGGSNDILGQAGGDYFGISTRMSRNGKYICAASFSTIASPYLKVYEWGGSVYEQRGSTLTWNSSSDEAFSSVDISNDGGVLAFGVSKADADEGARTGNGGVVKVYHWDSSTDDYIFKDNLLPRHPIDTLNFGRSTCVSGDGKRIIVAMEWHGSSATVTPSINTYEYDGYKWDLRQGTTIGATGNAYLGYGSTDEGLELSGDGSSIAVSDLDDNGDRGAVWVYNMPSTIKSIWGSNDNKNWVNIVKGPTREEATSNIAGITFRYDDKAEFTNIDNPNYYKYHAIIADGFTRLKDITLYGIRNQGSSTLHDGSLTLTKNLTVPRIGAPLDTDDTPRRDRLLVEYKTSTSPMVNGLVKDTSGRGNDGSLIGGNSTYNSSQKAFLFPGINSEIGYLYYRNLGYDIRGNQPLTVSFWARLEYETDTGFFYIGNGSHDIGKGFCMRLDINSSNYNIEISYAGATAGTGESYYRYLFRDQYNALDMQAGTPEVHNSTRENLYDYAGANRWFHFTVINAAGTKSADGSTYNYGNTDAIKLYINGVEQRTMSNATYGSGVGGTATDVLNLDPNPALFVGGYPPGGTNLGADNGPCAISEFKLYDCVLKPEEVRSLYDMNRTGNAISRPIYVTSPLHCPGMPVQVVTKVITVQYQYTSTNGSERELEALRMSIKPKFPNSLMVYQLFLNYEPNGSNGVLYVKANGQDIPREAAFYPGAYGQQRGIIPLDYDGNNASTPGIGVLMTHHHIESMETVQYEVILRYNGTISLFINRAHDVVDEHGISHVMITEIAQ